MASPFQTTLRWATEADFDALADVMFAAVREGDGCSLIFTFSFGFDDEGF